MQIKEIWGPPIKYTFNLKVSSQAITLRKTANRLKNSFLISTAKTEKQPTKNRVEETAIRIASQ